MTTAGGGLFDAAEEAGGPLVLGAPLAATHPDVRVVQRIGAGGMGVVYRVEQGGQSQAVKVLRPALRDAREAHQRFAVEQALLQRLDHTHGIVRWIDNGTTDDGLPFVLMEWIEGVRLDELPRGTFLRDQVQLVQQLAATLTYLSTAQVAHRDLKGSNILVERRTGRAVLCDFGIARDLAEPTSLASRAGTPGTEGYRPPDAEHTARTDVWSLAALFYELYAGRPPVAGSYEPPSAAGYPRATDAVLERGWAHDPAKRYPTPQAFAEALAASLDGGVGSSVPRGDTPSTSPSLGGSGPRPSPPPSLRQGSPTRDYVAGQVPLPFECIALKVLHDQVTAIVGGADGSIAAIDLRSGEVLAQTRAEDSTRARGGGGEIEYPSKAYLFLELAQKKQCFYTMSHAGVLNTWMFDGTLRHLSAVSLLSSNFEVLRAEIVKAKGRSGWSYWSCYSGDVPGKVPGAIMDAKLSRDGSSIVCLTDWFASFRCDLAGRLREPPVVIADAFAIEPATDDASEVWLGRTSRGSSLHRIRFGGGVGSVAPVSGSFGMNGIQTISPTSLIAGGVVHTLPDVKRVEESALYTSLNRRALALPDARLVLCPNGSVVSVYDMTTLQRDGEDLLAGHIGEVLAVDAMSDQEHVISVDARSLRIWNLKSRTPIGGYPSERAMLRHGIANFSSEFIPTSKGKVYVSAANRQSILLDMVSRSLARVACEPGVIAAGVLRNETHVVSVATRPGLQPPGARGLLSRAFKIEPTPTLSLCHHVIQARQAILQATVSLDGPHSRLRYWEPREDNSTGVDLGDGRLALLIAGHLVLYDLSRHSIIAGPIDVSGPVEESTDERPQRYYKQLIVSPDGSLLFVRAYARPIKIFDALTLRPLGEIGGSAGSLGCLIPMPDSQHVLFSTKLRTDAYIGTRDILAIGDVRAGRTTGELCPLNWSLREGTHLALMLPGGSVLAIASGQEILLIDLLNCGNVVANLGSHSTLVVSLHLCPNGDELMSTSYDGTARFWELPPHVRGHSADPASVLANVKPFSLDLVDVPR